jgi:acyl-CoA synthetase (NDP forming)
MAGSGAYDVLVLVHDFAYRSAASEVATANDVLLQLLAATRDRPELLPVYVSLVSGEPPPETKAVLDADGGGAPLLRGALESFRAIAGVAWWERSREHRLASGPRRSDWPALAADRTSFGADPRSVSSRAGARGRSSNNPRPLSELESLALVRAAGLATIEVTAVRDAGAAVAAAHDIAGPVALKLDAAGLAHKSDIGGVELGLLDDDAVRAAAERLLQTGREGGLAVRGLLVEPMVPPGLELLLGMRRDPLFGPVVVAGLGGTLTEIFDDVAIRLAPVDQAEAAAMLDDLRGARLLDGVRGRPAVDRTAVASMLVALGRLALERADIVEVDLNPVIAAASGAVAVDALVVLEAREGD